MDKAQFQRELECGAAFAIASRFLRRGLITQDEHRTLTAVLSEKYRPTISSQQYLADNPIPQKKSGG